MANQSVLIGWLDLNEEDQKMAKDYISALRTEGTVDELGFGVLRDAFANLFFPATNTIMTRTRYLIFLPVMYLKIEERQVRSHLVERVARDMEDQIRFTLSKTEKGGVIGAEAGNGIPGTPYLILDSGNSLSDHSPMARIARALAVWWGIQPWVAPTRAVAEEITACLLHKAYQLITLEEKGLPRRFVEADI